MVLTNFYQRNVGRTWKRTSAAIEFLKLVRNDKCPCGSEGRNIKNAMENKCKLFVCIHRCFYKAELQGLLNKLHEVAE